MCTQQGYNEQSPDRLDHSSLEERVRKNQTLRWRGGPQMSGFAHDRAFGHEGNDSSTQGPPLIRTLPGSVSHMQVHHLRVGQSPGALRAENLFVMASLYLSASLEYGVCSLSFLYGSYLTALRIEPGRRSFCSVSTNAILSNFLVRETKLLGRITCVLKLKIRLP